MLTKQWKSVISMLLVVFFAMQLAGCAGKPENPTEQHQASAVGKAVNLMAEITPNTAEPADLTAEGADVMAEASAAGTDFALRLFRAGASEKENTLVSPLSVLCALAMTANGANGTTLSQMEETLGLDRMKLNAFFRKYMAALTEEKTPVLHLANSVWFTSDNRFTANRDFLQTNADFYGSDVYQAPFDDSTVADINEWIKEKTDGMIPAILNQIPKNAVMYLVNALAFDAKWEKAYSENQIGQGEFTTAEGTTCTVDYLCCEENAYLEDENATGFVKYYEGGRYAFAAMLPNEDVSIKEYLASLDGKALQAMLTAPQQEAVETALPKFETSWSSELSELLVSMGMDVPFDEDAADYSKLGTSTGGNICINRVLHKTYLAVDENGTRAGAATVVEMTDKAAVVEPKEVYLTRPFVYFLFDCQTGIPIFIGTMMDPSHE